MPVEMKKQTGRNKAERVLLNEAAAEAPLTHLWNDDSGTERTNEPIEEELRVRVKRRTGLVRDTGM